MLVRYWQTAVIAAIMALTGNAVWAQQSSEAQSGCIGCRMVLYKAKDCCATGGCCKDGKCCKNADGCKSGKCCKDNKCECATGGDCCCKKGECNCKKTSCGKGTCCGCCSVSGTNTKGTTIIVVMPPALPMGVCGYESAEMMTHAPMPIPPGMMLPHPLPMLPPGLMPPHMASLPPLPPPQYPYPMSSAPCATSPCPFVGCLSSLLSMVSDLCCHVRPLNVPSLCAPAMGLCSPTCVQMAPPSFSLPRELASQEACSVFPNPPMTGTICAATPTPVAMPCVPPTPIADAKLRVNAKPSGDQLEMNFDDGTRIRCKKMTVTIADKEITLSRFDDRVRVRGEELKATADCVRGDRKDRLILDGGVVLHYKKDGHSAHVNGDHIEVNLATGAVKIESGEEPRTPSGTLTKPLDTDD